MIQEVDKLNSILQDREKTMQSLKIDYEKVQAENKRMQDQLLRYEILDTERQALEADVHQLSAELKQT